MRKEKGVLEEKIRKAQGKHEEVSTTI